METVRHMWNAALVFAKLGLTKMWKPSISQMLLYATTWKSLKESIDANSNKHPLLAQLDKEIDDEIDGEWDLESAAFHINDETDHDIEISDRESIQVWAVCVCIII